MPSAEKLTNTKERTNAKHKHAQVGRCEHHIFVWKTENTAILKNRKSQLSEKTETHSSQTQTNLTRETSIYEFPCKVDV